MSLQTVAFLLCGNGFSTVCRQCFGRRKATVWEDTELPAEETSLRTLIEILFPHFLEVKVFVLAYTCTPMCHFCGIFFILYYRSQVM